MIHLSSQGDRVFFVCFLIDKFPFSVIHNSLENQLEYISNQSQYKWARNVKVPKGGEWAEHVVSKPLLLGLSVSVISSLGSHVGWKHFPGEPFKKSPIPLLSRANAKKYKKLDS